MICGAELSKTPATLARLGLVTLLPHPGPLPLGEGEPISVRLESPQLDLLNHTN